jgi:hypothetical protein
MLSALDRRQPRRPEPEHAFAIADLGILEKIS